MRKETALEIREKARAGNQIIRDVIERILKEQRDAAVQPLLAADAKDLDALPYPLLASYKMDGIRAIVTPQGPVTRSLKPIPNGYIRTLLKTLPPGLDGELGIVENGAMNFRASTSAVMSRAGEPNFRFFVFDDYLVQGDYGQRNTSLGLHDYLPPFVVIVEQVQVENARQVRAMFAVAVANGHEGLILRRSDAPYKFGRSTLKEAILLKVKPWEDAEALVVDMVPEYENTNEAKVNALGRTERSSAKAGKVQKASMGTLVVERAVNLSIQRFEIGTGFTAADRACFWGFRDRIIGKEIVKFKFVDTGGYDVPRHCVFLGFRDLRDLSE